MRRLLIAVLFCSFSLHAQNIPGLKPGAHAPAFSLKDQSGKKQDLASLTGPKGLLVLFFRSADWCPFCKGQLVDLQAAQGEFEAEGVRVAAVSYDSRDILQDFAKRKTIKYPLLSDPHSELIDKFGIRNPEGEGIEAGNPYTGYYLLAPDGTIQQRFFEGAYVNRLTANNLYGNLYGKLPLPEPPRTVAGTAHLAASVSPSDTTVTPGAVVRLVVDLAPAPGTHLYAPGAEKEQYHVVALSIEPSKLYTAAPIQYPAGTPFTFPELHQTVPVYTGPLSLSTSVAATVDGETIPTFGQEQELTIRGTLAYQACTADTCFPPASVPVAWTLHLKPLDRERAPELVRHQAGN